MPRADRLRTRRAEHTVATRQALLREGRKLFASRGFAGAGIEEIARRARVTTGALYHHFADKRDLFQVVAEQVEQELMEQAAQAAARQQTPWAMLEAGIDVMLDACAAPGVHRIAFRDAPNVLGPAQWRAIEEKYAFGQLRALLAALMERGEIAPGSVDLHARVLLAVLSEVAESIAGADAPAAARAQASALVGKLLGALRAGAAGG
jgi:AcrR family transcriptional regulator